MIVTHCTSPEYRMIDGVPMCRCQVSDITWERRSTLYGRRKEDRPAIIRTPARPKIVCLCGSTRFTNQMLIKQWELTKAGVIVVSWCALPDSYFKGPHIGDAEGVKEIVDEVHKRKIDLCDEVLVLNIGGYIGESTRSEIDYAIAHGKPVRYATAAGPHERGHAR